MTMQRKITYLFIVAFHYIIDTLINQKNLQVDMWLSALRTAEYVITDSFHGTVFSILFRKKFIVVANEYRGLTRLRSLLKMFSLENRLIMKFSDFKISDLLADIDYGMVESVLNRERRISLKYLEHGLML